MRPLSRAACAAGAAGMLWVSPTAAPQVIGLYATALNDAGGSLDGNGLSRATIWNDGIRIFNEPLPGFSGSSAAGLNASGDLVGVSSDPACPSQATVWLPEGTLALPSSLPTGAGCAHVYRDGDRREGPYRHGDGGGRRDGWP